VHAIANVKICGKPGIIDNALERFLTRDQEEIREVAKETIEGALRGVLATLTPEQVNEERTTFVHALARDVEDDLNQLGITIDTLNIQSVSDDVSYLDNIGRAQIAAVLRDAEVAESDNRREAEQRIADAEARGQVADEQARGNIQRSENDLPRVKADLEAKARSAEERTEQAKYEARARAEVKLQEVRSQLQRLRLQADEVLPAEAEREAARLLAEGESAIISAEGEASAEAMRLVSEVWKQAGENAEDIFILQEIESLFAEIAGRLEHVKVNKVHLIDGGDGASLGKLAAAYPAMISSVFDLIADTTGVELKDILKRESKGRVRMPRRDKSEEDTYAAKDDNRFRSPRYGDRLDEVELEHRVDDAELLSAQDASSADSRLNEELDEIRSRVESVRKETTLRQERAHADESVEEEMEQPTVQSVDLPEDDETKGES
jgi:flotillin